MSNLMAILKAKHQPKQFALEQAEANAKHAERLAFIEGFKKQTVINKSAALFVSDASSPSGFKPNNN
jgi:hypothetical protein